MKKDGIYIMMDGLVKTIITTCFFSKQYKAYRSEFVLTFGNSFNFNWAPMIGISVMTIGVFLLWESQKKQESK